jgi:hypothetical protein
MPAIINRAEGMQVLQKTKRESFTQQLKQISSNYFVLNKSIGKTLYTTNGKLTGNKFFDFNWELR